MAVNRHKGRSGAGRRRRIHITGWTALSALGVTIVGFAVWAYTPYPTHPEPLREMFERDDLDISSSADSIVLSAVADGLPLSGQALLFYPGARVEPHAYATTFADTVSRTGLTVIIPRPIANLAIADARDLSNFGALAPDATITAVGGHSMGGVRACMMMSSHSVKALVLVASYCAEDISTTNIPTLSVFGSNDLLVSSEDRLAGQLLLPAGSTEVILEGASHASFGDYGPQSGDGVPTLSREALIEQLTSELVDFLSVELGS